MEEIKGLHYFDDPEGAMGDILLGMAKGQGYVPATCLLGGQVVMGIVNQGGDPCVGCNCDRSVCHGRPIGEGAEAKEGQGG